MAGKLIVKKAVAKPVKGMLYYVKDGSVYAVKAKKGGTKGHRTCKAAKKKTVRRKTAKRKTAKRR